jgi:hypothetical protein
MKSIVAHGRGAVETAGHRLGRHVREPRVAIPRRLYIIGGFAFVGLGFLVGWAAGLQVGRQAALTTRAQPLGMISCDEQGNLRFANIAFSGSPRVTLYVNAANVLTRLFGCEDLTK